MFDIDNYEVFKIVNFLAFFIGLVFGIVAQKNQFCFSGSIKDYMLTKSTKRASSVIVAIIVAITATAIMSNVYGLDLSQTKYFKDDINYFSIILGGSLFGIGMMLADGCSSRHLVKFAQGDAKSLVVILFIGIFAFATTRGILHDALTLITQNSILIKISSFVPNSQMNIYVVLGILFVILFILTKKVSRLLVLKDGVIIGLIVAASWYITGVIGEESMERLIELNGITFVYPTAQSVEFFTNYSISNLSFGISVVLGVLSGAFLMSRINKKYSFGCTASLQTGKIKYSMIGGALMGVGGVLAIGCTIGQGLTGISTLAFSSFLAILSILGSGYLTSIILKKKDLLPMCFIFEWDDEKKYNSYSI
jgi:uncharacterized membrane protein YedE/YeeE